MATLASMPQVVIGQADLIRFGNTWTSNGQRLSRTPPQSSGELGKLFDTAVGKALATMLGGIVIVSPNSNSIMILRFQTKFDWLVRCKLRHAEKETAAV